MENTIRILTVHAVNCTEGYSFLTFFRTCGHGRPDNPKSNDVTVLSKENVAISSISLTFNFQKISVQAT